jgi:hypothetical protein
MDEEKKCCSMMGHLWHRKSEVLGVLLIVLATIATLLSFSGLGLFGMFLAGVFLVCKRHWKCGCPSECCMKSCHAEMHGMCVEEKPVKKTKAKKND